MRVLITGASRGIGASIARRFAKDGNARIALVGRSLSSPHHPTLFGTLLDVARDVERTGATALPLKADASDSVAFVDAIHCAMHAFDGLDVLVNNASVLIPTVTCTAKQMDLLHAVNTRATALAIQTCAPSLKQSGGSIVTLSPPVNVARTDWIAPHSPYTISKYAMTLATFGASNEVRANCVWPRHLVATAATRRLEEEYNVRGAFTKGRDPQCVAEAVYRLATDTTFGTGHAYLDDAVVPLASTCAPLDLFVDE